jgi:deoxycytidylate deaminase
MPEHLKEMLDGNTFDICRSCHDELNDIIETAEREVLYIEHQRMYFEVLKEFLERRG